MNMIEEAARRDVKTLSEHQSKQLLSKYGIPVTSEKLARSEEEAVASALEIGYPVVLKGSGEALSHKTELDLIALDLKDESAVREAYGKLTSGGQIEVTEVLVQEMVKGDREFVIGMTRDPQFGPCVMFGLGGIFTEILEDVAFRVAPLSRSDAMDLMDDIKAKKILGSFRGKPAVDREMLGEILMAVGKIGLENEQVMEIDINPLKVKDGKPVAVDALVVLDKGID